jgi:site-specific DNA-methyltransferase (adenine-specific)
MPKIELIQGDCLEKMKDIPNKSIDMILCDLPYGTTACKWDTIIPFELMWVELKRIIKPKNAILLFGNEPFTSALVCSNLSDFKYRWDWDKKIPSGMSYARFRPMQQSEDICVFSSGGGIVNYYPQMVLRDKPIKAGGMVESQSAFSKGYKALKKTYEYKNPTTLIQFDKIRKGSLHPTQKPVALLEYLIKTYTVEGETVLDFTMGSGSTGIACKNLNRSFIGIELDPEYFKIAEKRINENL